MPAHKKEHPLKAVSFRFSKDELALLERIAHQRKITKTAVLREGIKVLAKTS
jgi:hypothetical protein